MARLARGKANQEEMILAPCGLPFKPKSLVTEQVCGATGGPQRYTGKSMYDSHAHLDITEQEWQAFLDDFRQTLDKFDVPEAEHAELFAIVGSTKNDIVLLKKQGRV
jgi:hemoglobin